MLHPLMEPVLRETFGVITYQEQVQQIARDLAGYSLGEADLLRRAMGKKIKAEMDAQRGRFVSGAVDRGVPKATADAIFDACAKFAEYGFNKGHSAPYALLTYQTAYLKANFPVEFLAASMTLDTTNTDKLVEFRRDAQQLGIRVEPPSVARSTETFDVENGGIRYSLAALRGVGPDAVKAIVAARRDGPFGSISDFARRLGGRLVNKRVVETLACAGAFDTLGCDRAAVFRGADVVVAASQAAAQAREGGQSMLFSAKDEAPLRLPPGSPWSQTETLRREFEAAGFFLSGHPLDEFSESLARLRLGTHAEFVRAVRQGATAGRLAVTVLERTERRTKTGNKMGILQCSDRSGQFEAVLFSETLATHRDLLEPGAAVLLSVAAAVENEDVRIRVNAVEALDRALDRVQKGIRVFLRDAAPIEGIAARLGRRGEGEVAFVVLQENRGEVEIRLPGRFDLAGPIVSGLKAVPGVVAVHHV